MAKQKKSGNSQFLIYKPSTTDNFSISEQFKTKLAEEGSLESFKKVNFKEKVGEPHPFDYNVVDKVVKKFGISQAILDKIADFTLGPGLHIESNDESTKEILEKWIKETGFEFHLRPWFIQALRRGTSYLEIAGLGDMDSSNMIKVVDSSTVYVKRDEFGEITGYNQYLGSVDKDLTRVEDDKIIPLETVDIVQIDINKIGNEPYGMGIVFSGLSTINDFLGAQKSMHKIMERKANSPIHVKMGSMEHEDYPEQADIDGFGEKLQYMDDTTEWVTGPNIEMNVIDFGNISEKFEGIINNDLKLLSYTFQVPEVILGASESGGLNAAGHAQTQMDGFERNIKSYQEQIAYCLERKVFDLVLLNNGKPKADYRVVWGQQSEEDKRAKLELYSKFLSSSISEGLKKEIEKKIAELDEMDLEEIERENKRHERRQRQDEERNHQRQKDLLFTKQNGGGETVSIGTIIKDGLLKKKAPQEIEADVMKFVNKVVKIDREKYERKT